MPSPGFEEFSEKVDPHGLYNIAPSQMCPIVRNDRDNHRSLGVAHWGLIPSWTKGKPKSQPINAKCETAASGAMFRQAMQRRRCLIPADGFYEWQGERPPKQPWFIHLKDDSLFCFAGLWERWKPSEDDVPIDTFTIITTQPNEVMQPIHNRMPVIVEEKNYDRWLDRNFPVEKVSDLLQPFDAEKMEAWKVTTNVNKPLNDSPELIDPLESKVNIHVV